MRCKKCQQSLYEYIDNTLPSEQSILIREHLDDCPVCLAFYTSERKLSQDFHETAARLEERLHFQFRRPTLLDRKPDPAPSWLTFPAVKWATAAIVLVVLIVCVKLPIVRLPESHLDRTVRVASPRAAEGNQTPSRSQSENGEGIIQVISIEVASGQLDETHYRWETDGLIAEITVEVAAPRVVRNSKG